jgi:hypothetical protein
MYFVHYCVILCPLDSVSENAGIVAMLGFEVRRSNHSARLQSCRVYLIVVMVQMYIFTTTGLGFLELELDWLDRQPQHCHTAEYGLYGSQNELS